MKFQKIIEVSSLDEPSIFLGTVTDGTTRAIKGTGDLMYFVLLLYTQVRIRLILEEWKHRERT